MKKYILGSFGFVGIAIFLPLFLLTFSNPNSIEKVGKSFIEWKLTSAVDKKVDSLHIPTSSKLGSFLNKVAGDKLNGLKQSLKDDLPALLAAEIAKVSNLSCECRKNWERRIANSINIEISSMQKVKERVADFSQAKYMEIASKLTKDVRVFLGVNSVVFILFILASLLRPKAVVHLFLPGALLLVSTVFCSYFYIFEQDWLLTILYDNYTGFAYLGYLAFVFGILCDIAFNKGRVTTEVVNGVLSAIGHASILVPC